MIHTGGPVDVGNDDLGAHCAFVIADKWHA